MVTAAMVGIDSAAELPRHVSTFTTRDRVDASTLREAQAQIVRQVRTVAPDARYCSFVEFTTGEGVRSGGRRRPHWHSLWKGLPAGSEGVVTEAAVSVLTRLAGAHRHECEPIRTPAGATMYVARHHLKESQAPPASWGRMRRLRPSRGYWAVPSADLRAQAAETVRERRIQRFLERAMEGTDTEGDGHLLDELMDAAIARPRCELVRVREGRVLTPTGTVDR